MENSKGPFSFVFLIISGILLMSLEQVSANQISEQSVPRIQMVIEENISNTTTGTVGNTTIILNAVEHVENETTEAENETAEVREEYRWVDSSRIENPDLNINSNTEYTIKIDNPTDEKHELIINSEFAGNISAIAGSGDIEPGKNIEFKFMANQDGELSYHCEYHPDQMNGTINVS
ncbi:MAG TPA: cupredoxin domain-containing protein [Nitrososphaeraceae archaeon]